MSPAICHLVYKCLPSHHTLYTLDTYQCLPVTLLWIPHLLHSSVTVQHLMSSAAVLCSAFDRCVPVHTHCCTHLPPCSPLPDRDRNERQQSCCLLPPCHCPGSNQWWAQRNHNRLDPHPPPLPPAACSSHHHHHFTQLPHIVHITACMQYV